jgi:hypothetical protein
MVLMRLFWSCSTKKVCSNSYGYCQLIQKVLLPSEDFLKTLFIVSDVSVTDEGSLGTSSPDWLYSDSVSILGKLGHKHLSS